jgi:amino acid adenylation domain-containing protein
MSQLLETIGHRRDSQTPPPDAGLDEGTLPLSSAQERQWFLHQLDPENPVHNRALAFRIQGSLSREALQKSLEEILRRHETLRSSFPAENGRPVQVIGPAGHAELSVADFPECPPDRREARVLEAAKVEARRPFDLAEGPLFRAVLFRTGKDEHLLLLGLHAIVADGWSVPLLLKELGGLYSALAAGDASPLPEIPLQCAALAAREREWLRSDRAEEQLAYWEGQLAGAPAVLDLAAGRPRPAQQTFRGAREPLLLPADLVAALEALGREEGVSLAGTLLAAFQTLLHRYTGQPDLVVGFPVDRRPPEAAGVVGNLGNTLVLRAEVEGSHPFRELLAQVQRTLRGACEHRDFPFEKLVERLRSARDLSYSPLFQVCFGLWEEPEALTMEGLAVRPVELDLETARYDVSLDLYRDGAALKGWLEYRTDLFDRAAIARMARHFRTLLEGIVSAPDLRLAGLPLLQEEERRQLLLEWNDTARPYPLDQCFHHFFADQAARAPERVAVFLAGQSLTYRELDRRSNQVARFLQGLGVGPDVRVGLCAERAPEMMVGLVGVLKAGGAYVPLDPIYPPERLGVMLRDAGAPVLLTQERLLARLPEAGAGAGARVVCLDRDWETISRESDEAVSVHPGVDSLAYVIYTSGSTGTPKGVMITHRGLSNYLCWCREAYPLERGCGAPVHSSIGFDLTVTSMLAPLAAGRAVVLVPDAPGAEIVEGLRRAGEDFSLVKLTPAHLAVLGQMLPEAEAATWTAALVIGGEALLYEHLDFWRKHAPDTLLINEYGPTETVVGCCVYTVQPGDAEAGPVPIGRPIANTRLHILDLELQPVPVGVAAELYIGGAGVARGYLNRPDLTAERFVPDPFGAPGERLYRTGDLARYRADGNIEFLGRMDQQVKIRGFRIELEEIEAVLGRHPGVRESVVVVREDQPGNKRLVAYLVPSGEEAPPANALRAFLQGKLPDYMVPAAFVALETLPLTPSGKVNRRGLPAPDPAKTEAGRVIVPPRDKLEEELAEIWRAVLNLPKVGITDSFFDLGGHSLLSVRLFAEIRKLTGRDLPLATLFHAPTVEQMARILRDQGWTASWSSLVPIQPNGARLPFFCIHGAGGNVVGYHHLARHLGPDQPFYGVQAQGLDGKRPFLSTIEEMAAHYIGEIRALQPEGPYRLGGLSFGGMVAFEMARQLHAQGQEASLVALFDTGGPGYIRPVGERILEHLGVFFRLGTGEKIAYARARARGIKKIIDRMLWKAGTRMSKKLPAGVAPALPSALSKVQNANRQAMKDYVPRPYAGRIVLFRAQQQPGGAYDDRKMGWGSVVQGGVTVCEVPGDHITLIDEPHVGVLAEHLGKYL